MAEDPAKVRARHRRYNQSAKGRERDARFRASTKGITGEVRQELARRLLRREPHEGQN